MHTSTYLEMEKFAATLPRSPLKIADIGSYDVNGTYRPIFSPVPAWKYVGFDIAPGNNVDVVLASKYVWSNVPDKEFDVVISGQVLEHTEYPWVYIKELARILKPGGRACVIAPYEWEYHAFPIDCWRIFPDGMKPLLEFAGLVVEKCYMTENDPNPRWRGDTVGIAKKP